MVICLERDADLHMAQLMPLPLTVSCFSKIQVGFTFLVLLTQVVPEKGPLSVCVCNSSDINNSNNSNTQTWLVTSAYQSNLDSNKCPVNKLEGKYSLESTDPRESEIRAHLHS